MNAHKPSASTDDSASKLLPIDNVVRLPTAKRAKQTPNAFTKTSIVKLHCPQGQSEAFFWDAGCRGLGIRALASGRRTWVYQYRDEHRRTRRIALGDLTAVRLDAAREAARRHAAGVTQGANPSVQRKAKRHAVSMLDVVESYLRHARTRQRPRSYLETERHLMRHAASLHHERVETVRRKHIAVLLDNVASASGPVAANRLRAALSALWSWGLRSGIIETDNNPVAFTLRQPEKARERVLSDSELKAIWNATAGDGDYARIVRLCLLTGCRRTEIGGLRWNEILDDRIVIGADRMKGSLAHELALLPMIDEALPTRPENAEEAVFGRRGNGFSGWSKSKEALDKTLTEKMPEMKPWNLHDLRRTFSTRLHDEGVEPMVIEALLAHKQQGVAAVYNRASFREAKKTALEKWHNILNNILDKKIDITCVYITTLK